jgi:hypothetical protein
MMTLAPKPCPTINSSAPPTYTVQQVTCRHTSWFASRQEKKKKKKCYTREEEEKEEEEVTQAGEDEEFVTKRPRGAQPTPCSPRDPIHVPP